MVSAADPYSILSTNFDMARRFMIQKVRVEKYEIVYYLTSVRQLGSHDHRV
jgi:hypothetical protein